MRQAQHHPLGRPVGTATTVSLFIPVFKKQFAHTVCPSQPPPTRPHTANRAPAGTSWYQLVPAGNSWY